MFKQNKYLEKESENNTTSENKTILNLLSFDSTSQQKTIQVLFKRYFVHKHESHKII